MKAPRIEDVRAAAMLVAFVGGLAALALFALVERNFEPQGGPFGVPHRIPTCGRSYHGGTVTLTLEQIQSTITPGASPVILEPLLGDLPLTAPFESHAVRLASGDTVCDTVVFLHVGADAYAAYDLEGGP